MQETRPLKLFISYAHKDEPLLRELEKHLTVLRRNGVIEPWYDREINPGAEWKGEIDDRLGEADIVLLLVSPDFLASDYCMDVEMKRAMEQHAAGEATVVPVILRPCLWTDTPFGKLQALSSDGKPISDADSQDKAFAAVATSLQGLARRSLAPPAAGVAAERSPQHQKLSETGWTVAPEPALSYLAARARHGRLVVLAGPRCAEAAGFQSWKRLGEFLNQELGRTSAEPPDIADLASIFVDEKVKHLGTREAANAQLTAFVERQLSSGTSHRGANVSSGLYPRLAQLPVHNFYTTNWDPVFYMCLAHFHSPPLERITPQRSRREPGPSAGEARHFVPLHGTPTTVEDLVVTTDDHHDFVRGPLFKRLQMQLKLDVTLLCVGYSERDLRSLVYLPRAAEGAHAGSQIYALLPAGSPNSLRQLQRETRIHTVDLGVPEVHAIAAEEAFLDSLLAHIGGTGRPYTPPHVDLGELESDRQQRDWISEVEGWCRAEGVAGPVEWFGSWSGTASLLCARPPGHPLLHSTYVDRGLVEPLTQRLKHGAFAGLTGLLGIGGVGKTFLAMKLAAQFDREGWEVVWVNLLEQGVEAAVDSVPAAYGLNFVQDLRLEETLVAIRHLFTKLQAAERKVLVVLDNAECFPNIGLLLDAMEGLPVLITSRTKECADRVDYLRLETMDDDEAIELCRLHLEDDRPGAFEDLDDADRSEIRELCRFLGGHPLGIRLVVSGYLRRVRHQPAGRVRFGELIREIRHKGLVAIPRNRSGANTPDELCLHETIYSTFSWLFDDLERLWPPSGAAARQLLPMVAAVAVSPVEKEVVDLCSGQVIEAVVRQLAEPFDAEQWIASLIQDETFEHREILANVAGMFGQLEGFGPNDLISIFRSIKESGRGLSAVLCQFGIQSLNIDAVEPAYRAAADRLPPLPSEQARGFQAKHPEHALALGWLPDLLQLDSAFGASPAIVVLSAAGLVDVDSDDGTVRMQPLIREFAFHERSLAKTVDLGDSVQQVLTPAGPALGVIYSTAVRILAGRENHRDSIIDLLPRLARQPSFLPAAIDTILGIIDRLYFGSGEWDLLRRLLDRTYRAALALGNEELAARVLGELGELLNRMEHRHGRRQMEAALKALEANDRATVRAKAAWIRAYCSPEWATEAEPDPARRCLEILRAHASDLAVESRYAAKNLEEHLAYCVEAGPSRCQLGLSSTGTKLLSNFVLDIEAWLDRFGASATRKGLDRVQSLLGIVDARVRAHLRHEDQVSPQRMIGIELACLQAEDRLAQKPLADLAEAYDDLQLRAQSFGIRGFQVEAERWVHLWQRAVLEGRADDAVEAAERNLASKRAYKGRESPAALWSEARLVATRAAMGTPTPDDAERAATLLQGSQRAGFRPLRFWANLALSLLHGSAEHLRQATNSMAVDGPPAPEKIQLIETAAERAGLRGSCEPCYSSESTYPRRVRSRRDGRVMVLVEGGLQGAEDGTVQWHYPFYVDQAPVRVDELARFRERRHLLLGEGPDALGVPYSVAEAYAKWAGKRLPTRDEWYVATQQLGHEISPEHWGRWDVSSERLLDYIEAALRDCAAPLVTSADGTVSLDLEAALQEYWSASWITSNPSMCQAFEERVVEPLIHATGDEAEGRSLAKQLAISPSMQGVPGGALTALSNPDTARTVIPMLVKIFEEEARQFGELDQKELVRLCDLNRRRFTQWLTDAPAVSGRWREWHPDVPREPEQPFSFPGTLFDGYMRGDWLDGQDDILAAIEQRFLEPLGEAGSRQGLAWRIALLPNISTEYRLELVDETIDESDVQRSARDLKLREYEAQWDMPRLRAPLVDVILDAAQGLMQILDLDVDVYLSDEAHQVWSEMKPRDLEDGPQVVLGCLGGCHWVGDGVGSPSDLGFSATGIRCVVPVFDEERMADLEPVDDH